MKARRILVAEDEAVVLMDIRNRLEKMGYSVAGTAVSGEEAIPLADSERPDLILMDIRLAGRMDGIEAAESIRARLRIPVVFLTASTDDATLERAKRADPYGYIIKPFNDRDLKTGIELAAFKHGMEQEIRRTHRLYALLSQLNQFIVRTQSAESLYEKMCTIAVSFGGFRTAWVEQPYRDAPFFSRTTLAGTPPWDSTTLPRELRMLADEAVSSRRPVARNDLGILRPTTVPQPSPTSGLTGSGAAIPFLFRGDVSAVMTLWSDETDFFQENELLLLDEMGLDVSFALEQIRKEEERREAEERVRIFESLAEASTDAIVMGNGSDLRITYANRAAHALFGCDWEAREMVGTPGADFWPTEDLPLLTEILERYRTEGWHGDVRQKRKDGTVFDANATVFAVQCEVGTATRIVAMIRDITESKRQETDRLELEKRLLHSQKLESLGVMAGGIAHDFNNLLMAILGNLEMALYHLPMDSPSSARIEKAMKASRLAAELTHRMLAYTGRGTFAFSNLDLNELVRRNSSLLQAVVTKNAVLNLRLPSGVPPIEADPGQIQQIVMNLITNASEAMGDSPGEISLDTGVVDCDDAYLRQSALDEKPPAGRFTFLEVSDTGCGMDETTRECLFDPFFSTKATGRGLGMSSVLGIVRGHNGAIMVRSAAGKGTTIRVLFPARSGEKEAHAPSSPEAGVTGTSGSILIVDDDESVRGACGEFVETLGFQPMTAADGEEAFSLFSRHGDDIVCVLLDLSMPRMNGVDTSRELRRLRPDIKIILTSGYSEQEATRRFSGEGIACFIQKPYHLHELKACLDRVLG